MMDAKRTGAMVNGAAAPIAPEATVSIGTGMAIVLVGRKPAPLGSPSNSMKVARASATTIETSGHRMLRSVPTLASASRSGTRLLLIFIHEASALATPTVRESWPGARRRRGRMKNVHQMVQSQEPCAPLPWEAARAGARQIESPANASKKEKQRMGGSTTAWTELMRTPSEEQLMTQCGNR